MYKVTYHCFFFLLIFAADYSHLEAQHHTIELIETYIYVFFRKKR